MNKSVKTRVFFWGGSSQAEYSGNALFLFFITREGEKEEWDARWLPIGSSYPLDDVYVALPCAAEHTALKEAFFLNPRESHPLARTPLPSKKTLVPPPLCCRPQLLPARFPWLQPKCLMWLDWDRLETGPHLYPQKTLVFQWDEGVLVLAGWSRGEEGFNWWGELAPGRGGNKRTRALSHALFLETPACTCR